MKWFRGAADPFPKWVRFPGSPSFKLAERLNLGAGDGISVRLGDREVPMDLLVLHHDCFVVKDPDESTHIHQWGEAVSFWKRVRKAWWW
jgi:hypothetical protein